MPAIIVWEGSMPGGKSGHEVSQVWVQTKHAKYLILFGLVRQFNGHDWHLVGTQNEPTADFPVLLFCITASVQRNRALPFVRACRPQL